MNSKVIFLLFILYSTFCFSAVKEVHCFVQQSLLSENDYPLPKIKEKNDKISKLSLQSIDSLLSESRFDQVGMAFKINLSEKTPILSGLLKFKSDSDLTSLDLSKANCRAAVANKQKFFMKCILKNPSDNQYFILDYLLSWKTHYGEFKLKVSESETGLISKNEFVCY